MVRPYYPVFYPYYPVYYPYYPVFYPYYPVYYPYYPWHAPCWGSHGQTAPLAPFAPGGRKWAKRDPKPAPK